jgi:DNA-binding response OmpR family regulator
MVKPPTVIVIEDDESMAEIFVEWITMAGISVLGMGYDGKHAVDLFEEVKPDVVILDLMMPIYDGFYAIEGIQKIDPNAKFLILTADMTTQTKAKIEKLKMTSLMYKPYDLDEVVSEVKKIAAQVVA